ARIAGEVGYVVTTFAPRDVHPEKVRTEVDLTGFDAAVIMTHNYLYDQTLLEAVIASPIPYVGLLGPKARGDELRPNVSGASRVHSPVGLDLGGETPEQIALAIMAEIETVLNHRSGRPLRELEGPLHVRASVPSR